MTSEARVWIELGVKPSKRTNSSNDVDQKTVLLHPNDAAAIDIRNGESALIIVGGCVDGAIEKSDRLNAVICKVQLSSADFASPKKRKEGSVFEGEVQFVSSWLSQRLMLDSKRSEIPTPSKNQEVPKSATQTKSGFSFARCEGGTASCSPQKSTSSESGFSFAKGGGGDTLISPPQKPTPSKSGFSFAKGGGTLISPQKQSSSTNQKCVLIPLHNLSREQLAQLSTDADELILCPSSNTLEGAQDDVTANANVGVKPYLLASQKIVQALIVSKYQGTYICASQPSSELMSIVFRGKIESFYVMNAILRKSRNADKVAKLSRAIGDLSLLSNKCGANNDASGNDAVLNEILEKCIKTVTDRVYNEIGVRITSDTRISFM